MAGANTQSNPESKTVLTGGSATAAAKTNLGSGTVTEIVPNPLHLYSSYTYNLSLSVLDNNSFNKATYKQSGPKGPFLAYSANKDPENRVETIYGKFDFFIEDLKISHLSGFENSTGNTNAIGFSFKIIEPYSMGLFFVALQQEALAKKHKNYIDAPLLLTLEFKGHLSTGPAVDIQNFTFPKLIRHYPLKLRLIDMRVSANGCEYDISAYPVNEYAFEQAKVVLQTPVSISGDTVEKILKTDAKQSFEVYINTKEKNQVEVAKVKKVPDEYVILFPDGPKGEPNPIKTSDLGFRQYDGTRTPFAEDNFVYENGVYKRGNIQIDPKKSEFTFAKGTDIPNLINQVIFMSNYGRNALKTVTADGFVNWWRVEAGLEYIDSDENLAKTGTQPKRFIYRIIPYRVSSSYFLPPNSALRGATLDKKLVVKEYNYIYSGENVDIIDFDINLKAGFYTAINADGGVNNIDLKLKNRESSMIEDKQSGTQAGTGQQPGSSGVIPTRTEASKIVDPRLGGNVGDTPSSIAAKQFHAALTSGVDMINVEMTILGDPYYLSDSGIGNYHAEASENLYINADGAMNWDRSEIHITVNFKTPVDIDLQTGLYDFGRVYNSPQFSGLYRVLRGESTFSRGKFIQKLKIVRLRNQEAESGTGELAFKPEIFDPIIRAEDGSVSNLRRSEETGELYDATGLYDNQGRAI